MQNPYYYNIPPPPRHVPWAIRMKVLFGGFLAQAGWLCFGFTMIAFWVFGSLTSFNTVYFLISPVETTSGLIIGVENTRSSENETKIYANHYTFRVERLEKELNGTSYTTGQQFSVGNQIRVEYINSSPTISRIEGARSGTFSLWVSCLVSIFPLIGLSWIVGGLRSGIKANRLLNQGKVGLGRLIRKESTNTKINNRRVFKLTFKFTADDGQEYETIAKSHQPHSLEDQAQEQLVYDPHNPQNAVMLDALPGEPDIDQKGNIQVSNMGHSLLVLVLPVTVLIINGVILTGFILANL